MSTPPQSSRKRARSGTVTVKIAPKPITLNTRIHRILNKAIELKHYSYDTSINQTSATLGCYTNFLSGIAAGTGPAGRLGDEIMVHSVTVTLLANTVIAGPSDYDNISRIAILKSRDNTLLTTNLTALNFTDLVFSGFNATGPLQSNVYTVYKDSKHKYVGKYANGAICGMQSFQVNHTFGGNGRKIKYNPGSTDTIDGVSLIVLESRSNVGVAGTNWTWYMGVTVAYRDA